MTGNCIGWITYSYLLQNHFIFWANAPGLLMSIWLNMAAVKLQYCDRMSHDMHKSVVKFIQDNRDSLLSSQTVKLDESNDNEKETPQHIQSLEHLTKLAYEITIQRTEAPAPHERVVVGVITVWLVLTTLISFLPLDIMQRELVIGIAVNMNMSFFYGAPLSTIFTVIKSRDSSSIHGWTMAMNSACALFFMLFGFGLWDYVLIVPNAIGVFLGAVQLLLCVFFPRSSSSAETDESDGADEEIGS
ncbi:hypothetical protein ACHAWF_012236 [Thalassiosira exigua]